jgi:DUF1365 family protein
MTTIEVQAPARRAVAALYEGTVAHRRFGVGAREFAPRLFLAYLDVDVLPASLDALPLWSGRRVAPIRFRRGDFLDGTARPLGDSVRDLVEERLGHRPGGPIFLLAHLRTFGWLFNPLAVYYCWSPAGDQLDAIVLEVSNTPWGERCWYVFDAQNRTSARAPKAMHVSPYLPMDLDYHVSWNVPGSTLRLRIEVERAGVAVFAAALHLRRTPLDRRSAIRMPARYPLLPLRVSAGIYFQAFALWLRRTPFYRHPDARETSGTKRKGNGHDQ